MGTSLHRGHTGTHGGRGFCSPGTLIVEGGLWKWSISLYGCSVRGTGNGGTSTGNPEGYVEKALNTDISLHRGLTGEIGSSFTRDFERWVKGALLVEVSL